MRTLLLLSLVLAGCSDSNNNTTVDAPPAIDAPAATPPLALDCNTYCTHLAADCTAGNAQLNPTNCMATCAAFPPGAQADTSGNTLGCRNYHLQNIEVRGMSAATHCPHAGPVGSLIATGSTAVCGTSACADFCAMEAKVCGTDALPVTGVTNRYTDTAACMTACGNFVTTPEASPTATTGNTFACRIYHLTNAAANAAPGTNTHCGHTLATPTGACI
jgi:hypothetical protein